jgi:Tc toxin complex TcA C-terminal TcB-binding domain
MKNQTIAKTKAFHGHLDNELVFHPGRVVETKETKYFIIQERELSYRFYLHQHPYVQPLVQRLLRKGTNGLQAADTEYNTRIKLTNATAAKDSFGKSVQLAAGELVYLADGATCTLDGSAVRFASSKVLKLLDNSAVTPAADKAVTIPGTTIVRRSTGAVVTTDADAVATLVDGVPLPVLYSEVFSAAQYNPSSLVQQPYPVKDIDFTSSGAYAVYNWELFFHVPITLAIHLSKNQRFAEAQRWFHYLFDPTDDSDGPTPERFWKVRPFQTTDVKKIEEILVNLATGADETLRNETIRSIEAWKDAPFRPHVIARYRQQAYMYKTVMAYLDNLIAWGDSLFRQDTGEAIDEAMMVYVLAANILGPRPLPVPKKGTIRPQTYANLRQDLAQFGTVMRDMEPDLPFDLMPSPSIDAGDNDRLATLRSLGKALYFCVPRNDKLLGYWDTLADRLFKIRNSLNLQGVFRQLALFEPPIDPALLARAAAAGLDVGAIVNGLNQPLPLVRFAFLVQKAAEIVQEVKSLGNSLLSAMEKEDGEALAILRARHERMVMDMVEHVKYGQLQEAIKSREGLLQTLALAVQRYSYYERQLGKKADEIEKAIPALNELDQGSLANMKFAMKEPAVERREVEVDIAQDLNESGGKIVSSHEAEELSKSGLARDIQDAAKLLRLAAQGASLIPDFKIDMHYWGIGGTTDVSGGTKLASFAGFGADIALAVADRLSYEAATSAKIGGYARRQQDWVFQSNLAAGEITQIFKQLRAAQIREAIAEQELKDHQQQIRNAQEIEYFLTGEKNSGWTQKIDPKEKKITNKALYAWMKREVKGLYAQCFQFAFDIAKKAERALQHELGNPDLSYLQFGYLAGKEGLLAGEKLYLDIKRMEMAYHDQNQREYELTRHISLLQLDPLALIQLRTTGRCTVKLPEALFDMDGPGHYFRRMKTVAVSIPCVTGPYASVNCTLTLLKSSIRKTPAVGDQYARVDAEDERFNDYFGSLQSIVTSSAQNDSGLFETNLRDERYLPFENSGAVSEWQLQLPANPSKGDPCQFDYDAISDVILHIRYTAREGGDLLRKGALVNLQGLIGDPQAAGSTRLFSLRHEFPSEWAKFRRVEIRGNVKTAELALTLREDHFPFWSKDRLDSLKNVTFFSKTDKPSINLTENVDGSGNKDALAQDTSFGDLRVGKLEKIALPIATKNPADSDKVEFRFKLNFDDNTMEDLWMAVDWGK